MITIRKDGLWGRWYHYWVWLGGKPREPENLCRFVRVVLIWGPLRWFFLPGPRENPPLVWLLAVALLIMYGRIVWLHPVGTLIFIGVVLGIIGLIFGIIFVSGLMSNKLRDWASDYAEASDLLAEHRAAKESKICPFIEFSEKQR